MPTWRMTTRDSRSTMNDVGSAATPANVFRVTPDRGLIEVPDSGGTSPRQWEDENRRLEAIYADGWYASITGDMFG